jgi:uncharacterized protein (TIGR02391 family)
MHHNKDWVGNMPIDERFLKFEDIETSRPDELGAEIVLDLQRTPNEFFSPTNFPGDLARRYQREAPTRAFSSAVREAIDWARRELLLVQHRDSTPPSDALTLSRRGLSFTRDDIDRLRLERILPDILLHDRIRRVCVDIFNTGHHQAAVFEAFRILEVTIREPAGYGQSEHGESMIHDAFNEKSRGPLVDATAPEAEQRAMRFLMVGSNGLFRNPRGHRDVDVDDPKEAAELLIVASHLLRMVEKRAAARKSQIPASVPPG